ncbi:hypothetical protein C2869_06960 [Saccharobesus litoralis]|uniref:Uncharacterized protein n=1 Tax=Saccharobesus litoralis TaxID=2172099 RepID=A0A2S0VQ30_9ALTE|nr:hypothetical protein [Saccharobesus litoralis]AWB66190.1 hypothetical protein C2869_06960 [Saccharobesus litoralis]
MNARELARANLKKALAEKSPEELMAIFESAEDTGGPCVDSFTDNLKKHYNKGYASVSKSFIVDVCATRVGKSNVKANKIQGNSQVMDDFCCNTEWLEEAA